MSKEDAPIYNKVDPDDCTHVGYFVPMGYEVFDEQMHFVIVSGKLCIRCGIEMHNVTRLQLPINAD